VYLKHGSDNPGSFGSEVIVRKTERCQRRVIMPVAWDKCEMCEAEEKRAKHGHAYLYWSHAARIIMPESPNLAPLKSASVMAVSMVTGVLKLQWPLKVNFARFPLSWKYLLDMNAARIVAPDTPNLAAPCWP
jgi:hypothetical protein